jgi:uncharacterized protein YukE
MPLDTEIKGDPSGLRTTARWLRSAGAETDDAASQVHRAHAASLDGWEGQSAEGFRTVMGKTRTKVSDVAADLNDTSTALTTFADSLDGCKARMAQAREIAAKAGLQVHGYVIEDPGPAPVRPSLPGVPTYGPWTAKQERALAPWKHAVADHDAKVQAYDQAALIVADCRHKEGQAQNTLMDFLDSLADDTPFNIADIATGLAGATIARTSRFRQVAQGWRAIAANGARLLGRTELAGMPSMRRAVISRMTRARLAANYNEQLATNTGLARTLDKLPRGAKKFLTAQLDTYLQHVPGLGKAARLAKPIPLVGTGITAVGVAQNIRDGENPVQAVAAGAGGMAAGGVVGEAVGGPPGLVIGAVVGSGVSWAIDNWGDDVVNGIGDRFEDMEKGIAGGIKSFGRPHL